jgi:hypothetical protein
MAGSVQAQAVAASDERTETLIDWALSPAGWRAWRKRLPSELRKAVSAIPPAESWRARSLMQAALREYRRMRSEAEWPTVFEMPLTEAARLAGVDADTVRARLPECASIDAGRGVLQIDAEGLVEDECLEPDMWLTMTARARRAHEIVVWMRQQLEKRAQFPELFGTEEAKPTAPDADTRQCSHCLIDVPVAMQVMLEDDKGPFPFRNLIAGEFGAMLLGIGEGLTDGHHSFRIEEAIDDEAELGRENHDITVDELSRLTRVSSARIRRLLLEHGQDIRKRSALPTRWLTTKAGQTFWRALEKKWCRKLASS